MSTWVYTKTDLFNEIREDLNDGNFFTAVSKIVNHLEAQEAAKPPAPVEWRSGDLVRWKRGEQMVQDRVQCVDGVDLWLKGLDFAVCAAECTLVKRAGE